MDQVSRPLLIALVAVVALAGAWLVVLRPKGGSANGGTPATQAAPGTAGLGRAVSHADAAVAASKRSAARAEAAAGQAPAATSATPVPAKPHSVRPARPVAPASKPVRPTGQTGSLRVMKALLHGKAVVLLFHGNGADDTVARQVLAAVRGPRVETISTTIGHVADYGAVTDELEVVNTPTMLVIGPDRRAQEIDGLPDIAQVQSLLVDALKRKKA